MVKAETFKKVGLFDEGLFIDAVDTDFCMRLNQNNIKMIRINNAILLHSIGETKRKNIGFIKFSVTNHSPLRRYYMTRNSFYIWKRYSGLKLDKPIFSKRDFNKEIIKVILFEKDRLKKVKFIIKGYCDYKRGVTGKLL